MELKRPNCAVILAGGLGTRLRSVVSNVPKPMAAVQGKPFLEHVLNYWKNQGIDNFILCVGYKSDLIIEYFGDQFEGSSIHYSIENQLLGTGGAVIEAVKKFHIKDPFILLNGDTFFEVDLKTLHNFSQKNKADWCFSLFDSDDESRYLSITIKTNGAVGFSRDIIQKSDSQYAIKNRLALNRGYGNGGVYWVNPVVFEPFFLDPALISSLENQIFDQGMKLGQKFYGLRFCGPFIDIGLPADYYKAQFMNCFRKNKKEST
jgi:D-glycero-alpha-D-manno-heptose 1-phosphate guanylyltransferase